MRFTHDAGKDVETTAVWHTKNDLPQSQLTAALDDLFKRRNHCLAAIKPKALGSGVLGIEKRLERFRFNQFVQDRLSPLRRKGNPLVFAFDPLLDPRLLVWRRYMHELDANPVAVRALQYVENLPDRPGFKTKHVVEEDRSIKIRFREAIGLGL